MTIIQKVKLLPSVIGKDINDRRNDPVLLEEVERTKEIHSSVSPQEPCNIQSNFSGLELNEQEADLSHDALSSELGKIWFHENARYVHSWGVWLLWDGERWLIDNRMTHMSKIGNFLKGKANALNSERESRGLKSAPFRKSIETMIKTDQICSVLPIIFDSNLKVIGTPSGYISLESGVLHQPDPMMLITKSTSISPQKKHPAVWLNFLDRIFDGDADVISFIKRVCGYVLTGLAVEERMFFCYGTGANGKSKFLETLFYVLGDYARRAPSTLFLESRNEQHPTSMAGLQGARLVLGSELPAGKTWNEETLKDLTGGDTITARRMRQDFFDYTPEFTLLIAGNHQPRLKNVDESMARRITLIPFTVTIPKEERDINLGEKLRAEAGAILNWCAEGAAEYFNRGLAIPEVIQAASRAYIENEDITGEFIQLFLEPSGERVSFDEVYRAYREWLTDAGNNHIKRDRVFKKDLVERGMVFKRSNSINWIENYTLKNLAKSIAYQQVKYDEI